VARISRTYLPIKAVISFWMDVCDHAPLILPKMLDQISLMLCWRSFSGCGWACEDSCFPHQGGWYIENEPWRTNVNIFRLTVAYLNATINVKPKTQNRRLEPTGVAKAGETRGLTGTGPGLACQDPAGKVFGRFWNRTDPFLWFKPGPLAGYLDPLLTLSSPSSTGSWISLEPWSVFSSSSMISFSCADIHWADRLIFWCFWNLLRC